MEFFNFNNAKSVFNVLRDIRKGKI
jgi:hypothetical protein